MIILLKFNYKWLKYILYQISLPVTMNSYKNHMRDFAFVTLRMCDVITGGKADF